MGIVYPLGVPLLYFFLLFKGRQYIRNRDKATNDIVPNTYSELSEMLYSEYDPKCWWWEVFECVRRLMLTGMLVFIVPGSFSQVAWALLMSIISLCMNSFWLPYVDNRDDFVAILATSILVINLIAGMLIRVDAVNTDGYDKTTFDWALLLINLSVLGAAVAITIDQFRAPLVDPEADSQEKKNADDVDVFEDGRFSYTNPVAGVELLEMAVTMKGEASTVALQVKEEAKVPSTQQFAL